MKDLHERILQIEALREIGWSVWDPLNLQSIGWREQGGENEYDRYLLHAAEMLSRGCPDFEVIEYLILVETDHMGMVGSDTASARSKMTVEAISALTLKEVEKYKMY